jgi:hypothetical protein
MRTGVGLGTAALLAACWGGEPGASVVDADLPSQLRSLAEASPPDARRRSGALLDEEHLAEIAGATRSDRPSPAVAADPAVDIPLPPELAAALSPGTAGGSPDPFGDLTISVRDARQDALRTALDSATLLGDGLPPAGSTPPDEF